MSASRPRSRAARGLLGAAYAWTLANGVYVYLVLGGDRLFRLETAIYIVAASAALSIAVADRRMNERHDLSWPVTLALGAAVTVAWLSIFALLTKETAVAAVLLVPAVDGFIYRWRRGPLLGPAYVALFLLIAAYLSVRSAYVTLESTFLVAPSQFFLKQLVSIPYKTLAQPWNAEALTLGTPTLLVAALVPVTLLVLVVIRGRGDWRLVFGPALILASTLPVYSYFFVDANLMASRYIYFAAAGWAILIADLVARAVPRRAGVVGAVAVAVAVNIVSLNLNLRPWRTVEATVTDMRARLTAGEATAGIVADWQTRLGSDLTVRDGAPRSYRGVFIFENSLEEFVAQSTRR